MLRIVKVEHRMYNERSLENLRPFNTLSPEERQKLARMGGFASGERRRYLANLRLSMVETLAGYDLAQETREEYRAAIKQYVQEERKKAAHREKSRKCKKVQT